MIKDGMELGMEKGDAEVIGICDEDKKYVMEGWWEETGMKTSAQLQKEEEVIGARSGPVRSDKKLKVERMKEIPRTEGVVRTERHIQNRCNTEWRRGEISEHNGHIYRIATLNINGITSQTKMAMLADFVTNQDIDIPLLQEVSNIIQTNFGGNVLHHNILTSGRSKAILTRAQPELRGILRLPSRRGMAADMKGV
jgi:hypothetical protein